MRFLFITYCFAAEGREVLIGVYKRGLRIALELESRGHEVYFDCTGRRGYSDSLTRLAEDRLRFVDLDLGVGDGGPDAIRDSSVRAVAGIAPDVVVVGEAPLAGTLLESTLCAVELEIPVVVLDNAYFPYAVSQFLAHHEGMVDGVVLTGPTCTHTPDPPDFVEQVPPFVTSARADAERLVAELGLRSDRLVAVLAYDRKVEDLAFSLLDRLDADVDFLILSKWPETCAERAEQLPAGRRERVRVVGLPPEPVLFGVIDLARLAVAKGGFMQVTECLALRTPTIAVYWEGTAWLRHLAEDCRPFTHLTPFEDADDETVGAARRFLALPDDAMAAVHDGTFAAAARTADFLEHVPARNGERRRSVDVTDSELADAVRALGEREPVRIRQVRTMCVRAAGGEEVHALACRYTTGGDERFARLWARRPSTAAGVLVGRARAARAGRTVLLSSARRRLLIERDFGHGSIPPTW